jgi:hypothetical protein
MFSAISRLFSYYSVVIRKVFTAFSAVLICAGSTCVAQVSPGDYFILDLDSQWNYVQIPGMDPLGDVTYSISDDPLEANLDIDGDIVTLLHTTTADPVSSIDENYAFFRTEDDGSADHGSLFIYGFRNGKEATLDLGILGSATVLVQDIFMDERLLLGTAGMPAVGTINDSTTFTVTIRYGGNLDISGPVNSTAEYFGIVPEISTPLGTFYDVLYMHLQITATLNILFLSFDIDLWNDEMYLARDIISGQVGAVPIVPPTSIPGWMLY